MWSSALNLAYFALFFPIINIFCSQLNIGVQAADVSIIFDEEDVVVNPGKRLDLRCGVSGQYRNCYWEKEDGPIFQVEDIHANLVRGMSGPEQLSGNECGIVIDSTTINDHGSWMCKIFVIGEAFSKSKNVIVTISPTNPVLEISNRPLVVNTISEQSISCTVAEARPRATISWYLGGEDITHSSESESSLVDNKGTYQTLSTLTRQFQPQDNAKRLICSVGHKTLPEPTTDVVDVDVRFQPVPQEPFTFYEIQMDTEFDISVNFSSNPPPNSVSWSFGDSFDNFEQTIPVPGNDIEGRYTANEPKLLPNGHYNVNLHINNLMELDVMRKFRLTVENDFGRTDYQVMLSVEKAPKGIDGDSGTDTDFMNEPENNLLQGSNESLSSGAVAGIVIVVLLVIFIVFVAAYARYHQMYCFAPVEDQEKEITKEAREEHSDTESARAPVTNKGQVLLKNLNKNISSIKYRLTKQKKGEDNKMSQMEEGAPEEKGDKTAGKMPDKDVPQTDEVVYAELDLGKEDSKKIDKKANEKTEYAQIIGTVDNKAEEKKE